jgi:predicted ester cyclase
MTIERSIEVARRVFEEGLNNRDRAIFDELVAPDYVNYEGANLAVSSRGPQNWTEVLTRLGAAFPDIAWRVLRSLADGDQVWLETAMSGTHEGVFFGHAPTGRRFEVRQVHMLRVAEGLVHEHRAVRDDLGVLIQLGLVSLPTRAAASE